MVSKLVATMVVWKDVMLVKVVVDERVAMMARQKDSNEVETMVLMMVVRMVLRRAAMKAASMVDQKVLLMVAKQIVTTAAQKAEMQVRASVEQKVSMMAGWRDLNEVETMVVMMAVLKVLRRAVVKADSMVDQKEFLMVGKLVATMVVWKDVILV